MATEIVDPLGMPRALVPEHLGDDAGWIVRAGVPQVRFDLVGLSPGEAHPVGLDPGRGQALRSRRATVGRGAGIAGGRLSGSGVGLG
ncbi:MAG: hypothetical protein H0V08_07230 [Thermoleophilaceae bacterium]|nr:hypothetical protein [Thermoleophilaceae bacterium]